MANTFTYKINDKEFFRKDGQMIIQHDDSEYASINKLITTLNDIKLELEENEISSKSSLSKKLEEAISMADDVESEIPSLLSYKDDFLYSR